MHVFAGFIIHFNFHNKAASEGTEYFHSENDVRNHWFAFIPSAYLPRLTILS